MKIIQRTRILVWLLLCCCFFIGTQLFAQNVAVNNTGAAPNASAILDVSAAGKGVLIPRMTRAQRPATPVAGLMIYQTDDKPGFYYFRTGGWVRVMDSTDVPGGAIVPFSSAGTISINIPFNGQASNLMVGVGCNTSSTPGFLTDNGACSFVAPRSGTIRGLSIQLVLTDAFTNQTNVNLTVSLYIAEAGTTVFNPVAAFFIPFPAGPNAIGYSLNRVFQNLDVPVSAGSRYAVVLNATSQFTPILFRGNVSGAVVFY